jgi:hypothetical protein
MKAVLGAAFITEGAIPFAAADPLRVIPALVAGSDTAPAAAEPATRAGITRRGSAAAKGIAPSVMKALLGRPDLLGDLHSDRRRDARRHDPAARHRARHPAQRHPEGHRHRARRRRTGDEGRDHPQGIGGREGAR